MDSPNPSGNTSIDEFFYIWELSLIEERIEDLPCQTVQAQQEDLGFWGGDAAGQQDRMLDFGYSFSFGEMMERYFNDLVWKGPKVYFLCCPGILE